jgi:hypothetical protein
VKRTLLVVAILIAVTGCNKTAPSSAESTDVAASRMVASEGDAAKAMAPPPPPPSSSVGSPVAPTPPGSVAVPAERKVIRNGCDLGTQAGRGAVAIPRLPRRPAATTESRRAKTEARRTIIAGAGGRADKTLARFERWARSKVPVTAEDITGKLQPRDRLRISGPRTRFRALLDKPKQMLTC